MDTGVVTLLQQHMSIIDRALHGQATNVYTVQWDPSHGRCIRPKSYWHHQDPIPRRLRGRLPPMDGHPEQFFVIWSAHVHRSIRSHVNAYCVSAETVLRRLAIALIWEKVQWHQQQAHASKQLPPYLHVDAHDVLTSAEGNCTLLFQPLRTFLQSMRRDAWQQHRKYFCQQYGSAPRWWCLRLVEREVVAYVAMECPTDEARLSFLADCRRLALQKARLGYL